MIIPGITWYYYMAALGMLSAAVAMVIELARSIAEKAPQELAKRASEE